jgi:hypothetical protein
MSILLFFEPFLDAAGAVFSDVWKRWGIAGILVIVLALLWGGTILHYEGIPMLRNVWLVDKIPWIGPIIEGKIHVKVDEAVAGAKHTFAIQSEMITAAAKLTAEKEYDVKVAIVAAGYKTLLTNSQAAEAKKTDDLNKEIAENAALRKKAGVPAPPSLDDGTAAILSRQGFRIHK